jgi:terpene synthase-like protein
VVRAAWRACNAAIVFMNDIHSVEAESAVGDPHNLVALLVRDGRRMDEAIGESARLAREAIGRLIVAGEQVPAACREMRLTGREADAVRRSVAAAQVWVRGYHDWARLTGRYDGSVPAVDDLTGDGVSAGPPAPIRSAPSIR